VDMATHFGPEEGTGFRPEPRLLPQAKFHDHAAALGAGVVGLLASFSAVPVLCKVWRARLSRLLGKMSTRPATIGWMRVFGCFRPPIV
jgi:hypothetical protein